MLLVDVDHDLLDRFLPDAGGLILLENDARGPNTEQVRAQLWLLLIFKARIADDRFHTGSPPGAAAILACP